VDEFLKSLHPIPTVLHLKIADILKRYDIKTVLDIGGIGRLGKLTDYDVTDANILNGIDGCNLPYEDNSFDASISISTLEHVEEPAKFLQECYKVAKKVSVHWFPYGDFAEKVEALKKKYGHWHPCHVHSLMTVAIQEMEFKLEPFMNCEEHLLLCMTLTPSLKNKEVYNYVIHNGDKVYGAILIGEK